MSLPSASSLDRVAACPASEALPHVRLAGTSDRDRGVVKHAFLAAVPNVGREAALALVPEKYREECALIDLDALPVDAAKFLAEVSFAFDIETGKGRVLGQNLNRDYSAATPSEVVGTVDVVGLTDDAVICPDVKTGHAYLDPSEMRQLKFLGLAASSAYGKSRAISGIIRLREDGSSYFSRVEFDEFALGSFELELSDIVRRVFDAREQARRGERLQTVEGEHCRYCPAFDYCPSKMALVKAFAAAPEGLGVTIEGATEEELARAWERASAVEEVAERVRDAIKLRARQRPVPLGNGWVLGESLVEESAKEGVATAVLTSLYGVEVATAAIVTKTSVGKTSIEKALRRYVLKPKMKVGELVDGAMEAIRAKSGFNVRKDVKKRKATPEDLAAAAQPEPEGPSELEQQLEASLAQVEQKKSEEAA